MITLQLHDNRYIALANAYEWRDTIKAMADYPDVKWDAAGRVWLVDARMIGKVIDELGEHLQPLTVDFVMTYPIPVAKAKRQTAAEKQAQKNEERRRLRAWGKLSKEMQATAKANGGALW